MPREKETSREKLNDHKNRNTEESLKINRKISKSSEEKSRKRKKRSTSESKDSDGKGDQKIVTGNSKEPNMDPNYNVSGNLEEYSHYYRGVKIDYNEPADSDVPQIHWRMYPFKEEKMLKPWYIHRQSAYLIGRDRRVIDIPIDHPSCSKQHAVIQYRKVPASTHCPNEFTVKPYIMDLGSANGTYLNNDKITIRRYYELLNKDVIRFAFSTREYVILDEDFHESSDSC